MGWDYNLYDDFFVYIRIAENSADAVKPTTEAVEPLSDAVELLTLSQLDVTLPAPTPHLIARYGPSFNVTILYYFVRKNIFLSLDGADQ